MRYLLFTLMGLGISAHSAEMPEPCETYLQQVNALIQKLKAENANSQQIAALEESIKVIESSMAEIESLEKEPAPKEMSAFVKDASNKMLRNMAKKCQSMSRTIAPVLNR